MGRKRRPAQQEPYVLELVRHMRARERLAAALENEACEAAFTRINSSLEAAGLRHVLDWQTTLAEYQNHGTFYPRSWGDFWTQVLDALRVISTPLPSLPKQRNAENIRRRLSKIRSIVEYLRPLAEPLIVVLDFVAPEPGDVPQQITVSPEDPLLTEAIRALRQYVKRESEKIPQRQVPHHTADWTTRYIRDWAQLIRERAHKPHWKELAVLLRHATGDMGWTDNRLKVLCSVPPQISR